MFFFISEALENLHQKVLPPSTLSMLQHVPIRMSQLQTRGVTEDNSKIIFFYFSIKTNIGYNTSLEMTQRDSSNDGLQHRF